jgi:holliday junction DNA helicase RuvA
MIASLSGTVKATSINSAVIDVGGVGILVNVSPRLSASLTVGLSAHLHTTLIVREDALTLYGFESSSDRELFEVLQTVTGIGPKVAQSALSVFDAPEIVSAIVNEKASALEKIPGLGKKGAQRLILELKEKVKTFSSASVQSTTLGGNWREQVSEALLNLGFNSRDTQDALDLVSNEFGSKLGETDLSVLLKYALQSRGRK